jgi:hypothetical protein
MQESNVAQPLHGHAHMKLLIISCIAALGLTSLVGCADNDRQTTTTSSYDSATVDSKDMHHRHQ